MSLVLCVSVLNANAGEADFLTDDDLMDDPVKGMVAVADPLELLNRATFRLNDALYRGVVEPVATVYQDVVPESVDVGVRNLFRNLRFPVRFVSNLLQGEFAVTRIETERFIVNTTAGLGGWNSPADRMDRLDRPYAQDMGHLLGAYGFGEGFYLVLPFLGPTTLRDGIGILGDRTVQPLHRPYTILDSSEVRWGLNAVEFVNASPSLIRGYRAVTDDALDPYASLKSSYLQRRREGIFEKGIAPASSIVRRRRGL